MSKIPPIRYVGNFDVASEGKNIWEILCSLKNLGTGRLIKKTEWNLRWPNQPSYLKIVKVWSSVVIDWLLGTSRDGSMASQGQSLGRMGLQREESGSLRVLY